MARARPLCGPGGPQSVCAICVLLVLLFSIMHAHVGPPHMMRLLLAAAQKQQLVARCCTMPCRTAPRSMALPVELHLHVTALLASLESLNGRLVLCHFGLVNFGSRRLQLRFLLLKSTMRFVYHR